MVGQESHRLVGTFRRLDDPYNHSKAYVRVLDMQGPLTFSEVSEVSLDRCLRWHPGGLNSWSLSDWFTALAGEVGEAGNVIKKLNRVRDGIVGNRETPEDLRVALGKELADCYLYLDLLAQAAGVDLADAICKKFNEVSVRNGFPERL
jgi:NTP pyrophosphatase (non-canonical NTP hydrolase)